MLGQEGIEPDVRVHHGLPADAEREQGETRRGLHDEGRIAHCSQQVWDVGLKLGMHVDQQVRLGNIHHVAWRGLPVVGLHPRRDQDTDRDVRAHQALGERLEGVEGDDHRYAACGLTGGQEGAHAVAEGEEDGGGDGQHDGRPLPTGEGHPLA